VLADAVRQGSKFVHLPKADGQASGAGGETEDEEAGVLVKVGVDFLQRLTRRDFLEDGSNLLSCFALRIFFGRRCEHPGEEFLGRARRLLLLLRRRAGLRPEHRDGVADLQALTVVLARAQQVV
jgi:hypothetical protein